MSFNDLIDLDGGITLVSSITAPAVVIIKNTNPCGRACDDTLLEVYKKAHAGDPISAYGGIIGSNRPLDAATAREISQLFYEAIIAPEFAPEALDILRMKKNLRLLATHCALEKHSLNGTQEQATLSSQFD